MRKPTTSTAPRTLAIDIGGTGLKSVILDAKGAPAGEFRRVLTPQPATPIAVLRALETSVREHGAFDRIAAGFPGVVRNGIVWTAYNLHPKWVGFDLAAALSKRLGKPARVANDADVQGLGAASGKGLELMVTLGTGLGSALLIDGVLAPNLELGHHPFRNGQTYEEQLGKNALDEVGKRRWNKRVQRAIAEWDHLFNYDALFLGGGNAKKLTIKLPANAQITPNKEGLLGGFRLWQTKK
jgi:polyphosphate glucokinase